MIDPPSGVAARGGVDHAAVIKLEQERVIRIARIAVGAPLRFRNGNAFAAVFDDPRAFPNRPSREHAAAVDRRMAYDVRRRLAPWASRHRDLRWNERTAIVATRARRITASLDADTDQDFGSPSLPGFSPPRPLPGPPSCCGAGPACAAGGGPGARACGAAGGGGAGAARACGGGAAVGGGAARSGGPRRGSAWVGGAAGGSGVGAARACGVGAAVGGGGPRRRSACVGGAADGGAGTTARSVDGPARRSCPGGSVVEPAAGGVAGAADWTGGSP